MLGSFLDRRLLFVTGKGGVGKTSVAAAAAVCASRRGRRTLLCEIDGKSDLARVFEAPDIAYKPREVAPGLSIMSMDTEQSLKEYLRLHVRLPFVTRLGPLAKTFDFVANAAPGVKEILTVGKLAYEIRVGNYDLVIADAPATGHVVGQLAAPQAIRDVVRVGVVRGEVDWILEMLHDTSVSGAVIVTTSEEMPVTETIELIGLLDGEAHVDVAAVVVNQVLPELFSRREEKLFERLAKPALQKRLTTAAGPGVAAVFDAAELAVARRRRMAEHLGRLLTALPDQIEPVFLPFIFTRGQGVRSTHQLSDALAAELGIEI